MPKFAANLTMLFQEYEFLERFKQASEQGFRYVEYLFPYEWPKETLKQALDDHQLKQVLFNLPPGDWTAGERGLASLPNRKDAFKASVDMALDYAAHLGVNKVHCMAGIPPASLDPEAIMEAYLHNVRYAAERCDRENVELLIEPINSRIDMPGYFLDTLTLAAQVLEQLSLDNLKIQFDVYHVQIMHGDLIRNLTRYFDQIGHIQFADNPGRREPGTGEINLAKVFDYLDEQGYNEWVSAEYLPSTNTLDSLAWSR